MKIRNNVLVDLNVIINNNEVNIPDAFNDMYLTDSDLTNLLRELQSLVKLQQIEIIKLKNDIKFISGYKPPQPTQPTPKPPKHTPPHKIPIEDRSGNRLDVCHWLRTGEKRWGWQNKG